MFGEKEQKTQNTAENQEDNKFEEPKTSKIDTDIKNKDNQEKQQSEDLKEEKIDEKTKLEEENKKLKDTLMRTLAELENTRRRASEENEKTAKYAIGKFAEDLIPVMENFHLAFKNSGEDFNESKAKIFFDGIKLTQNELKKVFEKNGLVRLFPIDEKFNPDFHNAISQIESDKEEGTIVDVMQSGYTIKGRLLRPALVIVSKGKNQ
ncbi:MAG: nucleotide exchange factor GrpE [Rickettsiales bacterium]|nr:nucleotide exchange factor GrpE [Rickettsiales bacterium]